MSQQKSSQEILNLVLNPTTNTLKTDAVLDVGSSTISIQGMGSAGVPSGSVLTIQGIPSGSVVPVSLATLPALPSGSVVNSTLVASEAHIGEAGGNCNIVSCEIIRPGDTTQYATNDVIGTNVTILGITSQPITGNCLIQTSGSVVGTTILDQDLVTISSVLGTTEANVDSVITLVDSTHFSIPVPFVHTWTASGSITKMAQADVARIPGGSGYINWLRLVTNNTSVTNATFDIYMFWTAPSAILDNAQQTILYSGAPKGIKLGTVILAAGGTGSDSTENTLPNINLLFKCAAGSKRLYFRTVNTSTTGYIPLSGQTFKYTVGVDLN
jgi:hypothetical protein